MGVVRALPLLMTAALAFEGAASARREDARSTATG